MFLQDGIPKESTIDMATYFHSVPDPLQIPVWSSSFGCGLCSLYDVKLLQVMRFQIFTRMRGEMLMLREEDIIILIGVIA